MQVSEALLDMSRATFGERVPVAAGVWPGYSVAALRGDPGPGAVVVDKVPAADRAAVAIVGPPRPTLFPSTEDVCAPGQL